MTTEMTHQQQSTRLIDAIVGHALQANDRELLRQLAQVLGLRAGHRVLLIAEDADLAVQTLSTEFGCEVEHYRGSLRQLPYAAASFTGAIVAVPVSGDLHALARELYRVLQPNGVLGMVAFSVYRDQMPDDPALIELVVPLRSMSRPAAAIRAMLAECGFTAFVSQDRRREVRRQALASYRQHVLPKSTDAVVGDAAAQALALLAGGGIGVTLITAEKAG